MIADSRIRAERRKKDLLNLGKNKDIGELETEIKSRDRKDSTRVHSPLSKAEDSIIIDTSHLDFREQVNMIVEKIKTEQKGNPGQVISLDRTVFPESGKTAVPDSEFC